MKKLSCKVCCEQYTCVICGYREPKEKEFSDDTYARQHRESLLHMHGTLRKAQSKTTGNAALDKEILETFGPWINTPKPLYVSPIKDLYDEAFNAEKKGNKNLARSCYKKLLLMMKDGDRINYKIGKAEIEAKVKEYTTR